MKADYVYKDTLTATDYVELNKNNELLMSYNQELLKENQSLKEQLEETNKMIEKCGFVNIEQVMLSYCGLIVQQEEFILYLRHLSNWYSADGVKQGMVNEILQKYREIIGGKHEIRT